MWIAPLFLVTVTALALYLYARRERIALFLSLFRTVKDKQLTISPEDIASVRQARAAEIAGGLTVLPQCATSINDYFDRYYEKEDDPRFRRLWKTLLQETLLAPGNYDLCPPVRAEEGPEGCDTVHTITVTPDHIKLLQIVLRFEGWTTIDFDGPQIAQLLGKTVPLNDNDCPTLPPEEKRHYEKLYEETVYVLQASLQHAPFAPGIHRGKFDGEDMARMMGASILGSTK